MKEDMMTEERGTSGVFTEYGETESTHQNEKDKYDCYTQCMDNAWDLQHEMTCSSVCGI